MTDPAGTLVIGVGSDLRADDAAGRHVAERIRQLQLDGVVTRSVHQLTPELAAELVGRHRVVVVDAAVDVAAVTVTRADGRSSPGGAMSHHLDVDVLVAMAALLGPPPGEALTVRIPAHDLDIGTELSDATARHVDRAFALICELTSSTGPRDGPVGSPSV